MPRRAKIAVGVAAVWVLSPIDLIPEFLPVIGPLDDVIVVALALRHASRQAPRHVLSEAWPGEERILAEPARPALCTVPINDPPTAFSRKKPQ